MWWYSSRPFTFSVKDDNLKTLYYFDFVLFVPPRGRTDSHSQTFLTTTITPDLYFCHHLQPPSSSIHVGTLFSPRWIIVTYYVQIVTVNFIYFGTSSLVFCSELSHHIVRVPSPSYDRSMSVIPLYYRYLLNLQN